MIGELESSSSDLCVVGGGVAGLLFGARAQDLGYCVRLI
jgi:glycerol-3-phosphate dehydrogenase